MSSYSHAGFPAGGALRKMSGDGPTQAKARGGDRPGDVPLHGPQPRAGGSLRVGEAFGDWVFASTAAKHPAAPPPIIKRSVSFLTISMRYSVLLLLKLELVVLGLLTHD